jgi:hypothetical protein
MPSSANLRQTNLALATRAALQHDVVTREQLRGLGVHWFHVLAQIDGGRWREVVPGVIVLHRGPLLPAAQRWVAVLAAGPSAAICSWTALELAGLSGWERAETHVVVPRGRHVPALPGVVVHESRRHIPADIHGVGGYPAHTVERAAVDAAAWSRSSRTASGLMAAVVQQRLTQPDRVRGVLDGCGKVRHRKVMFLALADVEGGAQALSEIDIARLCRSAGLPEPMRQRIRRDTGGRRRYLDAEWTRPDGSVVVLEIDGIGHAETRRWYDDLMRDAELVLPAGHRSIRLPASAARLEPDRVVAILARALGISLPA